MVPRIDFLPASFLHERQRRRKAVYRRTVVAAFVVLVALGAVRQWQVQKQAEETRDRLRTHARDMLAQLGSPDAIKQRIVELEARANLIALLRLHASPSRVLAVVAQSLPPAVTLTDLRYSVETAAAATPSQAPDRPAAAAPEAARPAEAADVERLRRESPASGTVVLLTGLAPDDVTVSRYLSALRQTGYFDETRLIYSEQASLNGVPGRKFSLRLRLRKPLAGRGPEEVIAAGVREGFR